MYKYNTKNGNFQLGEEVPADKIIAVIQKAALKTAEAGLPVFKAVGKKPAVTGWQDAATTDQAAVESIFADWDGNLAVAVPRGVVVIDADSKGGGPATLVELENQLGELPSDTVHQLTGSGGGSAQRFFSIPPGVELRNAVAIAPGIDIRSWGGLVIVPPSIHPVTGNQYEWVEGCEPWSTSIKPLPSAWLEFIAGKCGSKTSAKSRHDPVVGLVKEGGRNSHLASLAGAMRNKAMSEGAILAALLEENTTRCNPPLAESEVQNIASSVAKYSPGDRATALEEARTVIQNLPDTTPQTLFSPAICGALAVLKEYSPAEFSETRGKLRGKVDLRMLDRELKRQWEIVKAPPPDRSEFIYTADSIPDCPANLLVPSSWGFSSEGLTFGPPENSSLVLPVPALITARMINKNSGEEKVKLAWHRDGCWRSTVADRSTVFDSRKIISLADRGLPVTSANSKSLVRWFSDFEAANLGMIDIKMAVDQMGWHGQSFVPYDNLVIDAGDEGTEGFAGGYTSKGHLEEWKRNAADVRSYPLVRLMMAASFAAPLLYLTSGRTFLVHLWGPSRGGKSAALHAALSIWGEPSQLIASFNSTRVGLERLAAYYNDLPMAIDEKQVVGDRQGFVEGLIYMLGLGKSKLRGSKTGLQRSKIWRTIAMTTGEEPVSADNSRGGVKTRCLEVNGVPFPDEMTAQRVYQWSSQHHGHVGRIFIETIKKESAEDIEEGLNEVREAIREALPGLLPAYHSYLSVLAAADMVSEKLFFDGDQREQEEIFDSTIDWVTGIGNLLVTGEEANEISLAMNFIESWLAKNTVHLQKDAVEPYGEAVSNGAIYVLQFILDEALQKAGYSPRALRAGLAEKGYIRGFSENGKTRYTHQRRFRGSRPFFYELPRA